MCRYAEVPYFSHDLPELGVEVTWQQSRSGMWKWVSLPSAFLAGVFVTFVFMSDKDTSYKIGNDKFGYLEKSISQNSPFAKCKQKQSGLEAIIAGETADLSRVAGEVFQLQKQADDTARQFTKEGIARVPYAQYVGECEAMHSDMELSSKRPPTRCSSLLDEQIRNVQDRKRGKY